MPDQQARFWGIVPAAGKGSRMRQSQPKQYTVLGDRTIIEHSISALLSSELFEQVLVCIAPDDELWATLEITANSKVEQTFGGSTRAQSVLNGLNFLQQYAVQDDWVLVHDAARPCLRATTLKRMADELAGDDVGGILANRSNDTLKYASPETPAAILKTLDRSAIWRAQTPQMFRFGLLKNALSRALVDDFDITDEASAMEQAGHTVRLIEGDADNIKVTSKDDLAMAEFLLKRK